MSPIDGLLYGLNVVFTFQNVFAAFAGALLGTAIGVLPGLGPLGGIAVILPLTYSFDLTTGIIMMAGMYYGAMYGGSTTAILINMPGEVPSVMTCIDGYQLTKKGRAGAALSIVAIGSFFGGTISVIGVMMFSPLLAEFGFLFGPGEFFALLMGGLLMLSRVTGGTLAAGIFPMAIGLILSTIGQENVSATNRFTFGFNILALGVDLVPLVVGLYGIAEIMNTVETLKAQIKPASVKIREMLPTRDELRRCPAPFSRGTIIGFIFGLLPGPSATMSSFASYRLEKTVSKHRKEMGQGAIEGVAGPETANNAAATSGWAPMLSLGIPFGSTTALVLGAMVVQGVNPGPLLMVNHPEIFWGVIVSMYVGNVILLILNLPLIGVWVSLLRVPAHVFLTLILLIATIGSFSARNNMFDVYMLLFLGVIGYILQKFNFRLAPLVIGFVLGPLIEKHLREGLFLSMGDLSIFYGSKITIGIWIVTFVVVFFGSLRGLLGRLLGGKTSGIEIEEDI